MGFRRWFLRRKNRPLVRPWALLTPIVVLLIALPLLRPLRHPDPHEMSDQERAILAPVQSLIEHRTLAIEATNFPLAHEKAERNGHTYSTQAPTFPVLLSGSYWMMRHFWGATFDLKPEIVAYFLTLLGSTLPVALSAGLVYRMGRLFELKRPWRAALALASVLATGFISYATVLNPHAPAAAALLCSAACLIHLTITNRRVHSSVWLVLSGLCAALAAAIDPPATIFLLLFFPVVFAFRWTLPQRLAAGFAFAAGAAGPILMHVLLSAATGAGPLDALLHRTHAPPTRIAGRVVTPSATSPVEAWAAQNDDEEQPATNPLQNAALDTWRVLRALFGPHGLLSHFPVVLLGIAGVTMVMHRHWPPVTKLLASATLGGGGVILLAYAIGDADWGDAMFATRFFVVFLPLTFFWAGAWLRRSHRPAVWALASLLLVFSTAVSLIGATGPLPPSGFGGNYGRSTYTASAALRKLLHPLPEDVPPTVAAGG